MSTANLIRIATERRIVTALIRHMRKAGFAVTCVFDGETHHYTATDAEVLENVFAVDESSLRFTKADKLATYDKRRKVPSRPHTEDADEDDGIGGKYSSAEHGVWLICGNGEDIITDYNYYSDDRDGFRKAMDEFDSEAAVESGVVELDEAIELLRLSLAADNPDKREDADAKINAFFAKIGEVA